MSGCEVVEVRNSADPVGLACLKTASKECSDCGSELCEFHAETCAMCRAVFCPTCLSLHQEHPKPASADREQQRERKSAFRKACAIPSGRGWAAYRKLSPRAAPSPSRSLNLGRSSGVEMIRMSRIPASMSVESG